MFNKIINYFKNKKLERERREFERLAIEESDCEDELNKSTQEMLNKPCAINNFNKCSKDCIHFRHGSVEFDEGYRDFIIPGYYVIFPKCKLWGN